MPVNPHDLTICYSRSGDAAAVFAKDGQRLFIGHLDDAAEWLIDYLEIPVYDEMTLFPPGRSRWSDAYLTLPEIFGASKEHEEGEH
jgi:hypothetical protein